MGACRWPVKCSNADVAIGMPFESPPTSPGQHAFPLAINTIERREWRVARLNPFRSSQRDGTACGGLQGLKEKSLRM